MRNTKTSSKPQDDEWFIIGDFAEAVWEVKFDGVERVMVEGAAYTANVVWLPAPARTADEKPLSITFFRNRFAKSKRVREMTLAELGDLILETTAEKKTSLPWLKLASFGEERSERNCIRHNANVISISGIELDYDAKRMTLDEGIAIAEQVGLQALFYTSASYSDAAPKWRTLLPTSQPVPPGEREKLVARVNGLFGGVFAPESFTLSTAFYFGSVNSNPAHRVVVTEGDCIDLRDDLDAGAIGRNGEPFEPTGEWNPFAGDEKNWAEQAAGDEVVDLDELRDAMQFVPNDDLDWDTWNAHMMALFAATGGSDEGFELADEFSSRSYMYDRANTRKRWREIKRSPPHRTGAGKLFKIARENGWVAKLRSLPPPTEVHDNVIDLDVARERLKQGVIDFLGMVATR
jgi:hypothetical protein